MRAPHSLPAIVRRGKGAWLSRMTSVVGVVMTRTGGKKVDARPSAAGRPSALVRDDLPEAASKCGPGLYVSSKQDFDAFVQLVGSTVGEPPWFATPVEAKADGEWYVVAFDVAGRDQRDLIVTIGERRLVVRSGGCGAGARQAMRTCALPAPIDPGSIELVRTDELLTVRVRRKPSALADT